MKTGALVYMGFLFYVKKLTHICCLEKSECKIRNQEAKYGQVDIGHGDSKAKEYPKEPCN